MTLALEKLDPTKLEPETALPFRVFLTEYSCPSARQPGGEFATRREAEAKARAIRRETEASGEYYVFVEEWPRFKVRGSKLAPDDLAVLSLLLSSLEQRVRNLKLDECTKRVERAVLGVLRRALPGIMRLGLGPRD